MRTLRIPHRMNGKTKRNILLAGLIAAALLLPVSVSWAGPRRVVVVKRAPRVVVVRKAAPRTIVVRPVRPRLPRKVWVSGHWSFTPLGYPYYVAGHWKVVR
jgi:hypothetical protein